MPRWILILGLWSFLGTLTFEPGASAATPALTAAQTEFFENKVRPVLSKHCYNCHSAEATKIKGGLLLARKAGSWA